MAILDITLEEKKKFDEVVGHPLQTYEWGEFREKTGVKVVRRGFYQNNQLISGFQLTIHKIPKTPWTIGYLPKGELPTKEMVDELYKIGKENNCIFIQLEPNVIINRHSGEERSSDSRISEVNAVNDSGQARMTELGLRPAARPLFTKYTFVLDLTKPEEQMLAGMHPKARYNIKVAQKHNVVIEENNSNEAFEEYLKLTRETTKRQGFYAHTENYHRLMWQTLKSKQMANGKWQMANLHAHLLTAKYKGKILTAWILFVFKDILYYPYGASSTEHKEVMASNLMMWEAIRFGKNLGLKKFDMWGALGPNPDTKDPWYGFHNFKEKYGPEHVEFVGSYDLVINLFLYQAYKVADKLRWALLKIKR